MFACNFSGSNQHVPIISLSLITLVFFQFVLYIYGWFLTSNHCNDTFLITFHCFNNWLWWFPVFFFLVSNEAKIEILLISNDCNVLESRFVSVYINYSFRIAELLHIDFMIGKERFAMSYQTLFLKIIQIHNGVRFTTEYGIIYFHLLIVNIRRNIELLRMLYADIAQLNLEKKRISWLVTRILM